MEPSNDLPADFQVIDRANVLGNKKLVGKLEKNEQILYSAIVDKINRNNKKQKRTFLITTRAIINADGNSIKRRIRFEDLAGLTISLNGCEFVLHVPSEYDYRYSSVYDREELTDVIKKTIKKWLRIFYKEEVSLESYTTTRIDKKKGVCRMPKDLCDIWKPHNSENQVRVQLSDFQELVVLGKGAFGKVTLVQKNDSKVKYAMKAIPKTILDDEDTLKNTLLERRILEIIDSPFLVKLRYAFKTQDKVYMVMDFKSGGELFQHLANEKRFAEARAKFYCAELLLAMHHLHRANIIFRDLKPENVLLDADGHICLTDFGVSKILDGPVKRTRSFVGTPDYISPEVAQHKDYSFASDYWSLGILVYEMVYGFPPFRNKNHNLLFEMIVGRQVHFPDQPPISDLCKDLILKLLNKDQETRIGFEEAQQHPWFAEIDWRAIETKSVTPPFRPPTDLAQVFDKNAIAEPLTNTPAPENLPLEIKLEESLEQFTYVGNTIQPAQ